MRGTTVASSDVVVGGDYYLLQQTDGEVSWEVDESWSGSGNLIAFSPSNANQSVSSNVVAAFARDSFGENGYGDDDGGGDDGGGDDDEPTAAEILDAVGKLEGETKADIENDLQAMGFTMVVGGNGGSIWTKAGSDGNTVGIRLDDAVVRDPPKGFADEVDHAHKEIVPTNKVTNGNYGQGDATKYNDDNRQSNNPRETHIPLG